MTKDSFRIEKNLVSKDPIDGLWVVEVYQYSQNNTPMYSVFDAFKSKKQAIEIAKIINKNNEGRIRDRLINNENYLK